MSDCPKGLINDPYPGSCGLYVDQDQNQICDLSESQVVPSSVPLPQSQISSSINPLLFCLIIPIIIYAFTSKYKLFWNIILFITFIPTLISSLVYIFGSYGSLTNQLHLYFGTLFISIALCHTLWHWRYFFSFLKRKFF